ncbi:IS3 family transposase [Roseospira navarrensis]|uniref:Transposase n=1 Tax=Roseospira navarrensis TaxID=140058 RepID=A0A7X1ZI82_9PROT|nr:transposase [Roseospira navarrensis]
MTTKTRRSFTDAFNQDSVALLASSGLVASMSRKTHCRDNAPIESVFGTRKTERVSGCRYATRAEVERDPFASIEGTYTRWRLHSALGSITPEQAAFRAA